MSVATASPPVYSPWFDTPPTESDFLYQEWGTGWYFDGYAEDTVNPHPTLFERACDNAPAYGIGKRSDIGPGVMHPVVNVQVFALEDPSRVHYRNGIVSVQSHQGMFDRAMEVGVLAAPIPSNFPPESLEENVLERWWEFEGYLPFVAPRFTSTHVEMLLLSVSINSAGFFPNRTEGASLRLRWLGSDRLVWTRDRFGRDRIDATQPPFPSGGRPTFVDVFVPAEPDNTSTVRFDPPLRFVPPIDAGGRFGVEQTTHHVDQKSVAYKYALTHPLLGWFTRVTWPRHRYGWRLPLKTPPLRQRQRPDGLVFDDLRQFARANPTSMQRSLRQNWRNTYL